MSNPCLGDFPQPGVKCAWELEIQNDPIPRQWRVWVMDCRKVNGWDGWGYQRWSTLWQWWRKTVQIDFEKLVLGKKYWKQILMVLMCDFVTCNQKVQNKVYKYDSKTEVWTCDNMKVW